jgi:hypothetical protein
VSLILLVVRHALGGLSCFLLRRLKATCVVLFCLLVVSYLLLSCNALSLVLSCTSSVLSCVFVSVSSSYPAQQPVFSPNRASNQVGVLVSLPCPVLVLSSVLLRVRRGVGAYKVRDGVGEAHRRTMVS